MSIKRILSAILVFALVVYVLPVSVSAELTNTFMQVKRGTAAYLEPVEDVSFYAGRFKYSSIVESMQKHDADSPDAWCEIVYLYEENDSSGSEKRTVYVKSSGLFAVPPTRKAELTSNILVNDTDDSSSVVSGNIPAFEEALLVDHNYAPAENKSETVNISYTTRTSTVGDSMDISDILIQKTGEGTSRSSNIYTPLIRINESGDTNIQYPVDAKAESLLTAEESEPEYIIMTEYDMDPQVVAGLRFILENSPPFKTYTHYPADFENASRVAASLAIRAFLNDYYKNTDDIDIFNGIAPQDLTSFNNNYRSYMEHLYFGAVNAYEQSKNTEQVYISADISKEPYASGNQFITELRITTNNSQGWIINKSSLSEGVKITGAKETETEYLGEAGSVPISVIADIDMMGNNIPINICYNNTDPIVQFAVPVNAAYPTLVALARQSSYIPVKKLDISMPDPASLKIKAIDADSNEPLKDIKIRVSNSVLSKTLKTDQNGNAVVQSAPGTFSYESLPVDGYSSQFSGDITVASGKEETVTMAFERQKYTLSVSTVDAFDENTSVDTVQLTLKSLTDSTFEDVTKETAGGKVEFTGLPEGQYEISLVAGKTYTSLDGEPKISLHDNLVEQITICCIPVSGQLKLGCKLDDDYIENVEIEINKDGKTFKTAKTTKDGPLYVNLPAGTYTLRITKVPDGYKASSKEKEFKIKKNDTEGIKIKMEPDYVTLTICPRLPSDYENFKSLKSKVKDKSVSLADMTFALIAAEDIYNSDSEIIFRKGEEVVCSGKTKGKSVSADCIVIYPGKYIIRNADTAADAVLYEEVEINIDKSKTEIVLPVLAKAKEGDSSEEIHEVEETEDVDLDENTEDELYTETKNPVEMTVSKQDETVPSMNLYVRKPVTASVSMIKDNNGISCLKVTPVYLAADHVPVVFAEFPSGTKKETQTNELGTTSYAAGTDTKVIAIVPGSTGLYSSSAVLLNEKENRVDLSLKNSQITMTRVYMQSEAPEKAMYGLFVESWDYGKLSEEALKTPLEARTGLLGVVMYDLPLPAGKYFISPVLDYEKGGYDPDSKTYFEVTTPGDAIELTENRELMYQVTLTVRDKSSGTGLQGVYVNVDGNDKSVQYYTNVNGQVAAWMSPGKYTATVALVPEYYAIPEAKYEYILQEDGQISGETVIDLENNKITIKAQNEEDVPLYGVTVELVNQATKSAVVADTDSTGCVVFDNVPFGKYIIKERYPSAGYKTNSKRISITVDGSFINNESPVATFVDQKNTLTCVVKDDQGNGVANCLISVSDYSDSTVQTAYTNSDGRAVLENIPIGVYNMKVIEVPSEYLVPFDTNKVVVTANGITNSLKQTINVKKRAITIILKDSTGNGVMGAEFSLIKKDDASVVQRKTTGYDGSAAFTDFTKGEYIVRETDPLRNTAPVNDIDITIDENWVSGTPIELYTYPNYFEFNVMDNKGNPVALAAFTIENTETHNTKGDFSGKSGYVRFEGLDKGTYIIRQTRTEPGYELSDETITICIDEKYKISDKKYSFIVRKSK